MTYPQTPEALIALLKLHPDPVGYVVYLAGQVTHESVKDENPVRGSIHSAAHTLAKSIARDNGRGGAWETAFSLSYSTVRRKSHYAALIFGYFAGATTVLDLLPARHALVLTEAALVHLPKET